MCAYLLQWIPNILSMLVCVGTLDLKEIVDQEEHVSIEVKENQDHVLIEMGQNNEHLIVYFSTDMDFGGTKIAHQVANFVDSRTIPTFESNIKYTSRWMRFHPSYPH